MIKPMSTNELRYVLYEDKKRGTWVAVCLEHYIKASTYTREDTEEMLRCFYGARLSYTKHFHKVPFYGDPPAPDRFYEMWDSDSTDVIRGTIGDDPKNFPDLLA